MANRKIREIAKKRQNREEKSEIQTNSLKFEVQKRKIKTESENPKSEIRNPKTENQYPDTTPGPEIQNRKSYFATQKFRFETFKSSKLKPRIIVKIQNARFLIRINIKINSKIQNLTFKDIRQTRTSQETSYSKQGGDEAEWEPNPAGPSHYTLNKL